MDLLITCHLKRSISAGKCGMCPVNSIHIFYNQSNGNVGSGISRRHTRVAPYQLPLHDIYNNKSSFAQMTVRDETGTATWMDWRALILLLNPYLITHLQPAEMRSLSKRDTSKVLTMKLSSKPRLSPCINSRWVIRVESNSIGQSNECIDPPLWSYLYSSCDTKRPVATANWLDCVRTES